MLDIIYLTAEVKGYHIDKCRWSSPERSTFGALVVRCVFNASPQGGKGDLVSAHILHYIYCINSKTSIRFDFWSNASRRYMDSNADSNNYWYVWIFRVKCEISKMKQHLCVFLVQYLPFQAYWVWSPKRYPLSGLGLGRERTEAPIMKYGLLQEQDKSGAARGSRGYQRHRIKCISVYTTLTISHHYVHITQRPAASSVSRSSRSA